MENSMLEKNIIVTPKAAAASDAFVEKWLADTKARIDDGELPYLLNNYTPFEILQAMDIPYIELDGPSAFYFVGQLKDEKNAAAKAKLQADYAVLGKCGRCRPVNMPDFDTLPDFAGLITRQFECIGNNRILQKLCKIHNKPLFFLETSASMPWYPKYPKWWLNVEDNWDKVIEDYRLEHLVNQYRHLIRFLEIHTGKVFRMSKLEDILYRVNETCHYHKKIRDLVARTSPAPVGIADHVNVYSTFQHHGEPGVTEVMKLYYEEILELVEKGEALCQDERIRLYWCKGAWYTNMAYYRMFEKKYGATFPASWYMNLGADAYPRSFIGKDPLASMCSRRLFQGNYEGPEWDFRMSELAGCHGAIMHKRQMAGLLCYNTAELGTMRETYKMYFDTHGIPMLLLDPDESLEAQYAATAEFIESLS